MLNGRELARIDRNLRQALRVGEVTSCAYEDAMAVSNEIGRLHDALDAKCVEYEDLVEECKRKADECDELRVQLVAAEAANANA